ncbi:MAG: alpha/beta hydrolase [Candidatus Baltobacteraceae bacterium]
MNRRSFVGTAAATIAAARAGGIAGAAPTPSMTANASFGSLKAVDAGLLSVGYADVGPPDGRVVMLLHGWPYDIYSYVEVAPLLAARGYRVIVPYLRGFGTTQFRSSETMRNGEQVAFGLDTIALMDALKIDRAIVGGYDWGSRTAGILAALWPQRCKALVAVSGYLIVNLTANQQPLPPRAELGWWYQYYFSTERGRLGYGQNLHDFNKLIWTLASPKWNFTDATYDRTAQSFQNPDHVAIVIHNYRWRLELAQGDPQDAALAEKLQQYPVITVPTITIASDFDGAAASGEAYRKQFSGSYEHRILPGVGHNVPQEAPQAFAKAVVDADGFS